MVSVIPAKDLSLFFLGKETFPSLHSLVKSPDNRVFTFYSLVSGSYAMISFCMIQQIKFSKVITKAEDLDITCTTEPTILIIGRSCSSDPRS